jgi:hypothetical protein
MVPGSRFNIYKNAPHYSSELLLLADVLTPGIELETIQRKPSSRRPRIQSDGSPLRRGWQHSGTFGHIGVTDHHFRAQPASRHWLPVTACSCILTSINKLTGTIRSCEIWHSLAYYVRGQVQRTTGGCDTTHFFIISIRTYKTAPPGRYTYRKPVPSHRGSVLIDRWLKELRGRHQVVTYGHSRSRNATI